MSHYYDNEPSYPSGGNPWRNPDSEKNHLGNWALGLGIASIFCCGIIFGVTAIVLGLQAQAAADRGEATNRGAGPLELFWESLDSAPLSFIFLLR